MAAARALTRTRVAGALLVAPPELSRLRREKLVYGFGDAPGFTSRTPMIVVASDNDPYAKTPHVWRLSRQWDARFVNAGPFGHINADSGIGDWPYGQYLLASLQPAPLPAMADDSQWLRAGDWGRTGSVSTPGFEYKARFEYKERAHRS